MPRPIPRQIADKVKKLIDEITPYYEPEAIREFENILSTRKILKKIQ